MLAPVAAAVALGAWDPARNGGPPLCVFKACTGVNCPGCGLTRALGSLLRGRGHDAVTHHPLAPLLLVELVALWILAVARRAGRVPRLDRNIGRVLLVANAALLFGVWAARFSTGSWGALS